MAIISEDTEKSKTKVSEVPKRWLSLTKKWSLLSDMFKKMSDLLLNWKVKLFNSKVLLKVFKERLTPFTHSAKSENNAPNSAASDRNSSEESKRTVPNTTTTPTGHPLMPPPKNTTTCPNPVFTLSNLIQVSLLNMLIVIKRPTEVAGPFFNITVFPERNSGRITLTLPT